MLNKDRKCSGAIDNAMRVICKDMKGENIPDMVKPIHLPFFSTGAGKELVSD